MKISEIALASMAWLASSVLGPGAMAQTQTTDLPNAMLGWRGVELYSAHNQLSDGYANWRELGARGIYEIGGHQIAGEVASMNRFNQDGSYLGLGDTVVLDPHWYTSLAFGGGDGAAYLPRYRADAFLHRKLLPAQNLVVSLGLGRYKAPDGHRDDNYSLGAALYFDAPWILQAEIKSTNSMPNNVGTTQYFIAATWGRNKATQIIGRYGWGEEGYQSLGSAGSISRFASHQSTMTVKHWISTNWGLKASVERYTNPYYQRDGLQLAVFRDLP